MVNAVKRTIERKIERGEVEPEDLKECAKAIKELREEYPKAWSICTLANDRTLLEVTDEL